MIGLNLEYLQRHYSIEKTDLPSPNPKVHNKYIEPVLIDLESVDENSKPFKFTDKAQYIHKKAFISPQVKLGDREWPQHGIIFDSYSDPDAHDIFKVYGAKETSLVLNKDSMYEIAPWVKEDNVHYLIDDPHRGKHQFSISEKGLERLLHNGYAIEGQGK